MDEANRRIKFAYHLAGWMFEGGDKTYLKREANSISPSEYTADMDGNIFCPVCFTNLNRVPKDKDHFSNGRDAYFSHLGKYSEVKCDLRSTRPEGKRYDTYEEAQKAIDDENLVIVSSFVREKPEIPKGPNGEYDETPVEDMEGPVTDVPIARHSGESFKLPSKIKTVLGICRKFDENLYKYYFFLGQSNPIRLVDLLHDIRNVEIEDEKPKLYYGIITRSFNAGPTPSNTRMTELISNRGVKDFYLKVTDWISQEKGIHDDSDGRIVIVYGKVTVSGIGLCIEDVGWGEFALLPEKYNHLLI